ncbi:MAG: C25 family cysteine peptidase [bacterium]
MARLNNVNSWVWIAGFCGVTAFAAAPVAHPWTDLASPSPAAPTLQVLTSDTSCLSVNVTVPGFTPGTLEGASGPFTTLTLPGEGFLTDIGKPALPVIRRLIVVPDNAVVSCGFTGSPAASSLSTLGLTPQILPVQAPVPKIPGAIEAAVFAQDATLYSSQNSYPTTPVSVTEAGILFGRRLLSLEVCPFAIVPASGAITLYTNLVVTVTFTKAQTSATALAMTVREQTLLAGTVLNPPAATESVTASQKRLLIIAPDAFTNGLAPFITHKTNRGWLVDCFSTNSTGRSTTTIQAFIKNRYLNSATRPDALLLVGDIAQIPCFNFNSLYYPETDLYYGCMDGESDWVPEFPVGRFSVNSTGQLAAVISKSMTHEQAPLESWIKRATFLASRDKYTISEGTHNMVISNTFSRLGYTSGKLYCYTAGATAQQVKNAINKGCSFVIYSGHGNTTYWADGPVFYQSDVYSLTNAPLYPVIFSFACLTGQFSLSECFAETWLRTASKGAAAILSSSVTSLWGEDDTLEKSLITAIFAESQPTLGAAIWRAKQLYLGIYGTATPTTQEYFEQYNLLGDPTLEIAGLPVLTNGIPVTWFTSQGITNTNYSLELQEDRDGDGMTALQEYLTGTNPGDPESSLRLVGETPSAGGLRLRWLSANSLINPMPSYQIWTRTNLTTGSWMFQTNIVTRTPPTNEVQLAVPPGTAQLFYRISLTN